MQGVTNQMIDLLLASVPSFVIKGEDSGPHKLLAVAGKHNVKATGESGFDQQQLAPHMHVAPFLCLGISLLTFPGNHNYASCQPVLRFARDNSTGLRRAGNTTTQE